MMPGINPRQMQQMMRKMGIQQVEIPATEVIIHTKEKDIVITQPAVSKINMMGQETFQISGEIEERARVSKATITEEDIQTIMEQSGAGREAARKALEEADGDLAKAILQLQSE